MTWMDLLWVGAVFYAFGLGYCVGAKRAYYHAAQIVAEDARTRTEGA
jgi:hypothetical protein